MNFLAHYFFATRLQSPPIPLPAYTVGTALPDLLSLADAGRPHLRPQAVRLAPARSPEEMALRAGVLSHLAADAAFHKTKAFADAQAEAGCLLDTAGFTGIRVRRFFLTHILVELALDAALLRLEPWIVEEFYRAFEAAEFGLAARWTEAAVSHSLPDLPFTLARFAEARYLRHYRTMAGVATGLSRLCARARQDTFEGDNYVRLTIITENMVTWISSRANEMLMETAAGMAYPPTTSK